MLAHLRLFHHQAAIRRELEALDVEPAGIDIMAPKAENCCIRVHDVPPQDALILKQEMLSIGGEAAISRHALPPRSATGDVLVMGTRAQMERLAGKLTQQYRRTHHLGQALLAAMDNPHRRHVLPLTPPLALGERTAVMGILNVTPDSFYDGGSYATPERAVERALDMAKQGADLIDVGGESTRPGARPVSAQVEMERVVPVIEALADRLDIPLSVDTSKAAVAEAALEAGADMVNDVTALGGDPEMAEVIRKHRVPVCLMHMQGTPQTMQNNPVYQDVMADIVSFLHQRAEYALSRGISPEQIVLDPGLGFGKRTGSGIEDNCTILARLTELKSLGYPVMVGASRKAFVGSLTGCDAGERLAGSLGAAALAVARGADILRVHDVAATRQMAQVVDCIVRRQGEKAGP
ncbi:MAG: dihydropteroate synthase [Thermoplasmatota archaeon]